MSKCFEECQNNLNFKLFDVGYSNVKCQNDIQLSNVECSTFSVGCSTFSFECQDDMNDKCQTVSHSPFKY